MRSKRTRAEHATATSSSQAPPGSQPAAGNPGRKRRRSNGSDTSDARGSLQTPTPAAEEPVPKRKRGRPTTRAQAVIPEEESEPMEVTISQPVFEDGTSTRADEFPEREPAGNGEEAIELAQPEKDTTKHVRFDPEMDVVEDQTTATNITPSYPRNPGKMSIKRRTLSPNTDYAKRFKTASTRTSLPASLSQEEYDPSTVIQELQFAPLRTVLAARVQQLLAQREARRNAVGPQEEGSTSGGDMLVLDSQEEIKYPPLPSTPGTPTVSRSLVQDAGSACELDVSASPGWALRVQRENERRNFQNAILVLSKEAEEAQSQLRILRIELEALGFAGDEPIEIVRSIRDSLAGVRERIDSELPGSLADDAQSEDMMALLYEKVKEFAQGLRVADNELNQKSTLVTDLGSQIDGLLDLLAEKEVRNQSLAAQWRSLDESNEQKAQELASLEEELQAMRKEFEGKQGENDDLHVRTSELEAENGEFEKNMTRLTESLHKYREEEARLTGIITRMEDQHRATVTAMNRERQETVQELEDRMDVEITMRGEAETKTNARDAEIVELKQQLEKLEAERNAVAGEVERMKAELLEVNEDKAGTEAALGDATSGAQGLETQIAGLQAKLERLDEEVAELRRLNGSEHQQREAAERDLDDRNKEIDNLHKELHSHGKQANELRQKLWAVQQDHAQQVTRMGKTIAKRDETHRADVANEKMLRETWEEISAEHGDTIRNLEINLTETEDTMRGLLAEKDKRIGELESEVQQKDGIIYGLSQTLDDTKKDLQQQVHRHQERSGELDGSIAALQQTISEHESVILNLQQDAFRATSEHDSATAERDAAIAQLQHVLAEKETQLVELASEKAGLERRVEQEAEQMLSLQNEKQDEIDALRQHLRDKQAKILNVEQKAHRADTSWQEVLGARDEEISQLRSTCDDGVAALTALRHDQHSIRAKFENYKLRADGLIAKLRDQLAAASATVEHEGAELWQQGEMQLQEVEELVGREVHVKALAKVRRSARLNGDSGIGLGVEMGEESEGEGEAEESEGEAEACAV